MASLGQYRGSVFFSFSNMAKDAQLSIAKKINLLEQQCVIRLMPQARMQFNSDLKSPAVVQYSQYFCISYLGKEQNISISHSVSFFKSSPSYIFSEIGCSWSSVLLRLHISKHCIINPCTSEFPACNVSIVCAYTHGRKSGKIYFKAVKVDTWCWQEPECPKAS